MAKTVIRQIIVTLLLCLAILLILSVLLYAYVPNNKVIPERVSYTAPEEVQSILEENVEDESQVILTYEVNASDLNNAERINEYNPGKVNPFSSYKTDGTSQNANGGSASAADTANGNSSSATNNNNGSTNNSDGTSTKDNSTSSSEGSYFTDKGTK